MGETMELMPQTADPKNLFGALRLQSPATVAVAGNRAMHEAEPEAAYERPVQSIVA